MSSKAQLAKQMRLDKHLSQAEVANAMKISQTTYSKIELGKNSGGVEDAILKINRMRYRAGRTDGGTEKAGRLKE